MRPVTFARDKNARNNRKSTNVAKRVHCTTLDISFNDAKKAGIILGISSTTIHLVARDKLIHINGLVFTYIN